MKVSIVLGDDDVLEIERILLDKDREGALEFLKDIKSKIKAARSRTCGSGSLETMSPG